MREWRPGDVAMVNGRVCVRGTGGTWEHGDERVFAFSDHQSIEIRPLAVIDPEDREQVERLLAYITAAECGDGMSPRDALQAALREFADPQPPKPEEPQGLGAVVVDAEGVQWVRMPAWDGTEDTPWASANKAVSRFDRSFADIAVVRVLSPGVTDA